MKKNKYFMVALLLLTWAACKKEDYKMFTDVARIQFGPDVTRIYQTSFNLADTTKDFTFVYNDPTNKQDTVWFDIYAIGGISTKDRIFKLQQVADSTGALNAVPGVDYKAFTDASVNSKYVIKAGERNTLVPIVLLRSATLKTATVTLIIKVAANDDFQLGETTNIWRKVTSTDRLSKPTNWSSAFGTYSVVKHQFMINATGKKWDQAFFAAMLSDYTLMLYYTNVCKTALINYNNANLSNPLRDETGALVVFP